MWSHYANNSKGFCVGFYKEKLLTSLPHGAAGEVIYTDNFPKLPPLKFDEESVILKSFVKSEKWKHEEEYRFTQIWPDSLPTELDRKVKVLDEDYAEINLGFSVSSDHKNAILEEAQMKGIPVYQLKKKPLSFEIIREKIL